jgi:hypothetical protein
MRFLELLKTVDGIFMQRYMAVPEEEWTWQKFDIFTLKNLSALIGDEFYDGVISKEFYDIKTRYAELKASRKMFKDLSNRKVLEAFLASKDKKALPRWCGQWIPVWKYTRRYKTPFHLLEVDGILSQTRSAGQPPDLVKMQSKRKFLKTISEVPPPLTPTEKASIQAAIDVFERSLSPDVFTGLDTKARVTVLPCSWEGASQDQGLASRR